MSDGGDTESHPVFISYAAEDRSIAEAICTAIETAGIGCWIAPRDITPGEEYAEAIIRALDASRLMVLVFSKHANKSPHIRREVERSVHNNLVIIPFILEKFKPDPGYEYYIRAPHWLDATTPPLDPHVQKLVRTVQAHTKPHPEQPSPSSSALLEKEEPEGKIRSSIPRRYPRAIKVAVTAVGLVILAIAVYFLLLQPLPCDCTAGYTLEPRDPEAGQGIQFTDATVLEGCDPEIAVTSWSWDFGDGDSSSLQNPVHAYADGGTYTVRYLVTLSSGKTYEKMDEITVGTVTTPSLTRGCTCSAEFSWNRIDSSAGNEVQFTDASTIGRDCPEGTEIAWFWDFTSDGSIDSNEQNPVHDYTDGGTYNATLTIQCSGAVSRTANEVTVSGNGGTPATPSTSAPTPSIPTLPTTEPTPHVPIVLMAEVSPSPVPPNGTSEVHVTVKIHDGEPLPDAAIAISAAGGTFQSTGGPEIEGMTDSNGEYMAVWEAPTVDGSYILIIEASREGYGGKNLSTEILVG